VLDLSLHYKNHARPH